jgi:putative component of membrane protein insertase Oxa1/YidC/SpoIIIJ protein YidD
MIKEINKEQKDFLIWVLKSFDLPSTAIYKVKRVLRCGNYNDYGVDILNNLRTRWGGSWRTHKKHISYERCT